MNFKGLPYLVIGLLHCSFSISQTTFRMRTVGCNKCQNNNIERIPKDEDNSTESVSRTDTLVEPGSTDEREDNTWGLFIPIDEKSYESLNESVQFAFQSAEERLESHTCLQFKSKDDYHKDFIYFTNEEKGCFAKNLGKTKGKNIINLSDECYDRGIVLREIMYVLGFEHEHQRPDRDNYVTIEKQNISPEASAKFEKLDRILHNLSLPYDFNSITHFYEKEFSINGQPTITAKISPVGFQQKINRDLSELDRFKINFVYQCYEKNPQKFNLN